LELAKTVFLAATDIYGKGKWLKYSEVKEVKIYNIHISKIKPFLNFPYPKQQPGCH
jgi:hypothetical protein